MAYRVEITKTAEADLDALYGWVIAHAPHQVAIWFNGLEIAILSLDREPHRCPVAPESVDRRSTHPRAPPRPSSRPGPGVHHRR